MAVVVKNRSRETGWKPLTNRGGEIPEMCGILPHGQKPGT